MRSVLAEIGINHDGDLNKARRLIQGARDSGCTGIKFQYRNFARTYANNANQIGDEIISAQIQRTYIPAAGILELNDFAKSLDLQTGISFFTEEDLNDFNIQDSTFDFFKIPSAELSNINLIVSLLQTGKLVYISVGMHRESEIESIFSKILNYPNWIPMHCISNYPVADHNVFLGYIKFLKRKWNRGVGYSSHDENWENNIVALTLGAVAIERHITESVDDLGLDHSSSSTVDQFRKIVDYANKIDDLLVGDFERVPNQGELLNKQNLGRSFYALKSISKGSKLNLDEFSYRSPQIGIGIEEVHGFEGAATVKVINAGEALTLSHLNAETEEVTADAINIARNVQVSIPVRISDYESIRKAIPVGSYEFHLSYKEVELDLLSLKVDPTNSYSVHLPDYVNSTTLIDPFSLDSEIRDASLRCIKRVLQFSEMLSDRTSKVVPIVASLAGIGIDRVQYYLKAAELISKYSTSNAKITLQWLPPFAWYFGGSVKLSNMCQQEDVKWINENQIPITLDTSHLILGKNYYNFDALKLIEELLPLIAHWHISDAIGSDGEGMQLGDGGPDSKKILGKVLAQPGLKVIEVWQGHFNNYEGFKTAINRVPNLITDQKR